MFLLLCAFFAFRHVYRTKEFNIGTKTSLITGLGLSGISLYFAIVAFASSVYPYIPAVKGGGDYTSATPVVLAFDTNRVGSLPKEVIQGLNSKEMILLDASSSSIFLASIKDAGGPAEWRKHSATNRPAVYEIRRDAVVSIGYATH
jgi:hypothetical protein